MKQINNFNRDIPRLKNLLLTGDFKHVCSVCDELQGMKNVLFYFVDMENEKYKELSVLTERALDRLDEITKS